MNSIADESSLMELMDIDSEGKEEAIVMPCLMLMVVSS